MRQPVLRERRVLQRVVLRPRHGLRTLQACRLGRLLQLQETHVAHVGGRARLRGLLSGGHGCGRSRRSSDGVVLQAILQTKRVVLRVGSRLRLRQLILHHQEGSLVTGQATGLLCRRRLRRTLSVHSCLQLRLLGEVGERLVLALPQVGHDAGQLRAQAAVGRRHIQLALRHGSDLSSVLQRCNGISAQGESAVGSVGLRAPGLEEPLRLLARLELQPVWRSLWRSASTEALHGYTAQTSDVRRGRAEVLSQQQVGGGGHALLPEYHHEAADRRSAARRALQGPQSEQRGLLHGEGQRELSAVNCGVSLAHTPQGWQGWLRRGPGRGSASPARWDADSECRELNGPSS